jgi:hypothetical protein
MPQEQAQSSCGFPLDVFLTRDEPHFINKRETLEKQFTIKIRLPSQLLLEIEAAA